MDVESKRFFRNIKNVILTNCIERRNESVTREVTTWGSKQDVTSLRDVIRKVPYVTSKYSTDDWYLEMCCNKWKAHFFVHSFPSRLSSISSAQFQSEIYFIYDFPDLELHQQSYVISIPSNNKHVVSDLSFASVILVVFSGLISTFRLFCLLQLWLLPRRYFVLSWLESKNEWDILICVNSQTFICTPDDAGIFPIIRKSFLMKGSISLTSTSNRIEISYYIISRKVLVIFLSFQSRSRSPLLVTKSSHEHEYSITFLTRRTGILLSSRCSLLLIALSFKARLQWRELLSSWTTDHTMYKIFPHTMKKVKK